MDFSKIKPEYAIITDAIYLVLALLTELKIFWFLFFFNFITIITYYFLLWHARKKYNDKFGYKDNGEETFIVGPYKEEKKTKKKNK